MLLQKGIRCLWALLFIMELRWVGSLSEAGCTPVLYGEGHEPTTACYALKSCVKVGISSVVS